MKIKTVMILVLIFTLRTTSFYGCDGTTTETPTQETTTQIIKDITVEEAYNLIEENEDNTDFMIIDARTPDEYASGHIENSVLIDINGDDFEAKIGKLDKEDKYLVYCLKGGRSRNAVNYMQEQGFQEAYNMLGGIDDWKNAGFPTVE